MILLFWGVTGAALAQTPTPPPAPQASVIAMSAFLRAAPAEDAPVVSSVFEGEILAVRGRSVDGFWLWVNRPYQPQGQAWIRADLLTGGFDLTLLPLGRGAEQVALLGAVIPVETGYAAVLDAEAQLRAAPARDAQSLGVVPRLAVIPVVARTPDGFWLKVNYLGIEGWVAEFLTRSGGRLTDVPIDPLYAADPRYAVTMPIIPREVQRAQADRLLGWLAEQLTVAENVAFYWSEMANGKTMECVPPAPIPALYPLTPQDYIELPELRQEVEPIARAVESLNSAIDAMRQCGIYTANQLNPAMRAAFNARFIFCSVIDRMTRLRKTLER
jgi:hypothetical protein